MASHLNPLFFVFFVLLTLKFQPTPVFLIHVSFFYPNQFLYPLHFFFWPTPKFYGRMPTTPPTPKFRPTLFVWPTPKFYGPTLPTPPTNPRTHELIHPRYSLHAHYLAHLIGKECIKVHFKCVTRKYTMTNRTFWTSRKSFLAKKIMIVNDEIFLKEWDDLIKYWDASCRNFEQCLCKCCGKHCRWETSPCSWSRWFLFLNSN